LPKPHFLPKITCTVTNDISYDQRMQRICSSLANAGYEVLLIGREMVHSKQLGLFPFKTKRVSCFFNKGFAFYAEYNVRLFFILLFTRTDGFYAVDLDTILPNYLVSLIKNKPRLYDAHELFTEMKEIVTRPKVQKVWLWVERFCVPKFKFGYTVNLFIKDELKKRYGVDYGIIRNIPTSSIQYPVSSIQHPAFIIYQGAVNEGRSFETLVPAMKQVDCKLIVCGEGNFFEQTKQLVAANNLENKIELKGYVSPTELKEFTPQAKFGLTLFENTGLNQYYSLSNRFFDYIMAGIPQVCVGYPEYKAINDEHEVALLIDDVEEQTIANAINQLLNDGALHERLAANCLLARETLNWENEEKKLVEYWKRIFQ
jgi:glycosyltransferase involved in cell wall biosynthesis